MAEAKVSVRARALAWAMTTAVLFAGNVLFHGHLAAAFFDKQLAGIALPMAQLTNPIYPLLVAAWIAVGTVWFAARGATASIARDGAVIGALLGLIAYGTWHVINLELIPGWPWPLVGVDTGWHIAHGAAAGMAGAWVVGRDSRRSSQD